jgi:hypothetical protein
MQVAEQLVKMQVGCWVIATPSWWDGATHSRAMAHSSWRRPLTSSPEDSCRLTSHPSFEKASVHSPGWIWTHAWAIVVQAFPRSGLCLLGRSTAKLRLWDRLLMGTFPDSHFIHSRQISGRRSCSYSVQCLVHSVRELPTQEEASPGTSHHVGCPTGYSVGIWSTFPTLVPCLRPGLQVSSPSVHAALLRALVSAHLSHSFVFQWIRGGAVASMWFYLSACSLLLINPCPSWKVWWMNQIWTCFGVKATQI